MPTSKPDPCLIALFRLIGIALQMPPAIYVAWTGHAPAWARIWLAVFVGIWLLYTVLNSVLPKS